jgi:hypothetical protein
VQLTGPAFTLHAPPAGGTGTATATIGTLAVKASASFRLVVHVQPSTLAVAVTATATVTTATLETNSANDVATATATVIHPTPVVTALPLDAFAMTALTDVPVASVQYASGAVPAGLLGASIDWGDGTVTSGQVNQVGEQYVVSGSHTYTAPNVHQPTVNFVAADGQSAGASSRAVVHTELFADGTQATTPQERFVQSLYRAFLHRGISQQERLGGALAGWLGALANLGATQTVGFFQQAPEVRADAIDDLYRRYLGREVDPIGLAGFQSALAAGATYEDLSADLLGSSEFLTAHGGPSATALDAVFESALGRTLSASDVFSAMNSLPDFLRVVSGVLHSSEYEKKVVTDNYGRFFLRGPDDAGLASWSGQLSGGDRDEAVLARMLGIPGGEDFMRVTQ